MGPTFIDIWRLFTGHTDSDSDWLFQVPWLFLTYRWLLVISFCSICSPVIFLFKMFSSGLYQGKSFVILGSGCGCVSRAVASDNRGPMFKSSHQPKKCTYFDCLKDDKFCFFQMGQPRPFFVYFRSFQNYILI